MDTNLKVSIGLNPDMPEDPNVYTRVNFDFEIQADRVTMRSLRSRQSPNSYRLKQANKNCQPSFLNSHNLPKMSPSPCSTKTVMKEKAIPMKLFKRMAEYIAASISSSPSLSAPERKFRKYSPN